MQNQNSVCGKTCLKGNLNLCLKTSWFLEYRLKSDGKLLSLKENALRVIA
jgi:hypothetical protein